jgi:hypothetical protein
VGRLTGKSHPETLPSILEGRHHVLTFPTDLPLNRWLNSRAPSHAIAAAHLRPAINRRGWRQEEQAQQRQKILWAWMGKSDSHRPRLRRNENRIQARVCSTPYPLSKTEIRYLRATIPSLRATAGPALVMSSAIRDVASQTTKDGIQV